MKTSFAASSLIKILAAVVCVSVLGAIDLPAYYNEEGGMKSFPQPFFPPDSLWELYQVCYEWCCTKNDVCRPRLDRHRGVCHAKMQRFHPRGHNMILRLALALALVYNI
jgi:hypothetical protein